MQITVVGQTEKELKQLLKLVNARAAKKHEAASLLSLMISTELTNALKLIANQSQLNSKYYLRKHNASF